MSEGKQHSQPEQERKRGFLARVWSWLGRKYKQGEAEIKPYAQGGLKDLQNAVIYPFPEDHGKQADVLGMAGNSMTPGAVDRAKDAMERDEQARGRGRGR